MTDDECREALTLTTVGRAAVVTPQGPYLVPVNYAVVGNTVYFRVRSGTELGSHIDQSLMAFEVDRIAPLDQTGWSVLARGTGRLVDDPAEVELVESSGPPRPWLWKPGRQLYAMDWTDLSGRRMWDNDY